MANRVYVAGALNASDATLYIKNMHRMVKYSIKLRKAGYSVFVPALDFLMGFLDGNFNYHDYFYNSWWWIKVAEAIYVVPESSKSKGTQREVALGKKLGIPVFYKISDMDAYFLRNEGKKKKKTSKLKKLFKKKVK